MIKIYIPNISNVSLGGGYTFLRNFTKALDGKVEFVKTWKECDIVFVFGITTIDKTEIHEAVENGKKLVLRIDNIPRRSRNKRMNPVERLKEFGKIASAVIYQSKWCKEFAGYFIDNENEFIINNGVDTDIFNQEGRDSGGKTCLYIDYNPNPNKRFEEALYRFEMLWREDNEARLIIVGNTPKIYKENPQFNWDLNVPATVNYIDVLTEPYLIAKLMKSCDFLLYPSFAEAAPNTLIEAMACGVIPMCMNPEGGTIEMYDLHRLKPYTIYEMGEKYLNLFKKL